MTVNRFKPVASAAISLSENGEYVRYEDYASLLDELEAAEKRIAEQREYYEGVIADGSKRIAELAALTAEPAKCGHVNVDCDDGKAVCLSCGEVWEV